MKRVFIEVLVKDLETAETLLDALLETVEKLGLEREAVEDFGIQDLD